MLDTLPDHATWEDFQYSIYVRERVERGRREADEEKLVDREEVELRMKQLARRVTWTESALRFPDGRVLPEGNDLVRELFVKTDRLIYEIRQDRTVILAFIHRARRFPIDLL